MNRTIDRDSDSLLRFAEKLNLFSSNLSFYIGDFISCCNDASDTMQDASAQQAIYLLSGIAESLKADMHVALLLSEYITKSAKLMEESDSLL